MAFVEFFQHYKRPTAKKNKIQIDTLYNRIQTSDCKPIKN